MPRFDRLYQPQATRRSRRSGLEAVKERKTRGHHTTALDEAKSKTLERHTPLSNKRLVSHERSERAVSEEAESRFARVILGTAAASLKANNKALHGRTTAWEETDARASALE